MSSRRRAERGIRGVGRVFLDELQDALIGDEAALDDLGHAGDQLVLGQRGQGVEVHQHAGRRVEGADQVLALGGVDAGLAAHRGVDHAQQRGRDVDDLDAAQPGGGDEAGQVGDGAAADGDDGVGAGEVVLAQHLPAEGGNLDVLALFGVGDLGGHRGVAGGLEVFLDGVAGGAQGAGVDDQHLLDALAQQAGQAAQQAVADDDVVVLGGGRSGDVNRRGCGVHRWILQVLRSAPRPQHRWCGAVAAPGARE